MAHASLPCTAEACPTALPWFAKGDTTVHTAYAVECAGTGTCDYTTGTCVCQDGFTGSACNHSTYGVLRLTRAASWAWSISAHSLRACRHHNL